MESDLLPVLEYMEHEKGIARADMIALIAEALLGKTIPDKTAMEAVAKQLSETFGCTVLLKGGHRSSDADDVLYEQGKLRWFHGEHIPTHNTHGTGCTLSSAIAVGLAEGCDLPTAVQRAKDYVLGALKANLHLGHGCGPIDHTWKIKWEL